MALEVVIEKARWLRGEGANASRLLRPMDNKQETKSLARGHKWGCL